VTTYDRPEDFPFPGPHAPGSPLAGSGGTQTPEAEKKPVAGAPVARIGHCLLCGKPTGGHENHSTCIAQLQGKRATIVLRADNEQEVEFAKGCAAALEAYRKRNEVHAALESIIADLERLATEPGSNQPS